MNRCLREGCEDPTHIDNIQAREEMGIEGMPGPNRVTTTQATTYDIDAHGNVTTVSSRGGIIVHAWENGKPIEADL